VAARVRVPATSANLGPGYDSFGLALALYDVFDAEPAEAWRVDVVGEGEGILSVGEDNEVVRAMKRVFAEVGYTGAAIVRCDNGIPVGRGLGSSAAAIVGGLLLGDIISGSELTRERIFELASELEGHPDNVAAAVFGGFTMCWSEGGAPRVARIEPGGGLAAVVAVSDTSLPTVEAREALPDSIPHVDAAFSAGRAGLLSAGITLGRSDLIAAGLADRLHEPYRERLVPDAALTRSALISAGATGAVLSGAGPTVLGLLAAESDGAALELAGEVADRVGTLPGRHAFALGIDRDGAEVH
jgi:homoserine kinase